MDESTSIPFARILDSTVALERIAWWRPASRFVVIQYKRNGHIEEFGKRLDLDKRAFLDSFDDPGLDAKLSNLIPEILQMVAAQRLGAERAIQAPAWSSSSA